MVYGHDAIYAVGRRKAALLEEISRVWMCWEVRYPLRNRTSRVLNPLNGHRARQANDARRRKCGANGFRLDHRQHQYPGPTERQLKTHHNRGELPHWVPDARHTNRSTRTITRTPYPTVGMVFWFCIWTGASEHHAGGFGRLGGMELKAQALIICLG